LKINPTFSQLNPLEQGRLNRGVSDQVRQKFEQITVERSQTKGVTDKQFLNSLNKDQLETLRTFHGLAFDIQTSQLSDEGAHNLVSETNDLRDLNGDGNISIGQANMFIFPPPGAPSEVYEAFSKLSSEDQQSVYQAAASKQGMHELAQQNSRVSVIPGRPNTNNIFSGSNSSYDRITDDLLTFLLN
jgi:hypothetical protein